MTPDVKLHHYIARYNTYKRLLGGKRTDHEKELCRKKMREAETAIIAYVTKPETYEELKKFNV